MTRRDTNSGEQRKTKTGKIGAPSKGAIRFNTIEESAPAYRRRKPHLIEHLYKEGGVLSVKMKEGAPQSRGYIKRTLRWLVVKSGALMRCRHINRAKVYQDLVSIPLSPAACCCQREHLPIVNYLCFKTQHFVNLWTNSQQFQRLQILPVSLLGDLHISGENLRDSGANTRPGVIGCGCVCVVLS